MELETTFRFLSVFDEYAEFTAKEVGHMPNYFEIYYQGKKVKECFYTEMKENINSGAWILIKEKATFEDKFFKMLHRGYRIEFFEPTMNENKSNKYQCHIEGRSIDGITEYGQTLEQSFENAIIKFNKCCSYYHEREI